MPYTNEFFLTEKTQTLYGLRVIFGGVMCQRPAQRRRHFSGDGVYISVIENESFRLALKNTGRFLAFCIPLLLALSLGVALMLYWLKWCKNFLKTTYLLPLAIPVTSVVLIIQAVFHKNGLLSALVVLFGGQGENWLNSEHAFTVLVICYLWKNLGCNVVL